MTRDGEGAEERGRSIVRRMRWSKGTTRPIGVPIQPSIAYRANSPDALDNLYEGRLPGFSYARDGHQNAAHVAERIDGLEGAVGGLVVGSGMAEVGAALMSLPSAGDHGVGGTISMAGRSECLPGTCRGEGLRPGSRPRPCFAGGTGTW